MQVNLSGTERWQELCRLLRLDDDGGLDFAKPAGLAKLSDRGWRRSMMVRLEEAFASRTGDQWEVALLGPAGRSIEVQHAGGVAGPRAGTEQRTAHRVRRSGSRLRSSGEPGHPHKNQRSGPRFSRRHGAQHGALAGHRVIDLSSFWAGPLAARLLAELGADVVKVEPPGGEGAYQLMPIVPNIYIDANRSKRGLTLDLREEEDRMRLFELVAAADVVVENAVAGTWERLGLDEGPLRSVAPGLVYARAKGFGMSGPLALRPSFDYVVQAATGMEMTQGAGKPQPVNVTANDYGTGLHLAAGVVLGLLGRARGVRVATVEASLMMTATVFQAEDVAQLAIYGRRHDVMGPDLCGPTPECHLYEASDGWVVICAVTPAQQDALGTALAVDERSVPVIAKVVESMTVRSVCSVLHRSGVPVAVSAHPGTVPDDVQVRNRGLLVEVRHPMAGPYVQVGVPLHLSVDVPAVRGPAPTPAPGRRSKKEKV